MRRTLTRAGVLAAAMAMMVAGSQPASAWWRAGGCWGCGAFAAGAIAGAAIATAPYRAPYYYYPRPVYVPPPAYAPCPYYPPYPWYCR